MWRRKIQSIFRGVGENPTKEGHLEKQKDKNRKKNKVAKISRRKNR